MIKLPEVTDYTEQELSFAKSVSPACEHYIQLLTMQPTDAADSLRLARHQQWLKAALATIHQKAETALVCKFWSHVADEIILRAWQDCGLSKYPLSLFAFGKLGAEELNLSSDVDLLLVIEDNTNIPIQEIRKFQSYLSVATTFGFCFRVDFDLRPGGRFGPLVSTLSYFENYYGSVGETWERLAFIRLRALTGPSDLIANIHQFVEKFTYRKHLDYTLLGDLKELRKKIHAHYGEDNNGALNLKLGIGGIRDIELYCHSLQVIYGGKNHELRCSSTETALARLAHSKIVEALSADHLLKNYWMLRHWENYAQLVNDQQVYTVKPLIPISSQIRFVQKDLTKRMQKTNSVVSQLLGKVEHMEGGLPESLEAQKKWLQDLGFKQNSVDIVWPSLIQTEVHSRNPSRDETARLKFLYQYVQELVNSGLDKDFGLEMVLDFVKATRAKSTFFTLLLSEVRIIRDLAYLFSASPYLGSILSSRPELIDSFFFHAQPSTANDFSEKLEQLAEQRLLNDIIAAANFLSEQKLESLLLSLSSNADSICNQLFHAVKEDLSSSSKVELLCLGKWGSRELGFQSDLDFIFITDDPPQEEDHKLVKRFLSRLNDQHKGGQIYSYDLRLRPNGAYGPLLVEKRNLRTYLATQAEAWERQAYLKARFLRPLSKHETQEILSWVRQKKLTPDDLDKLNAIRIQLLRASVDSIDLKYAPGGLVETEFAIQIAVLHREIELTDSSTLSLIENLILQDSQWAEYGPALQANYKMLRTYEQLYKLVGQSSETKVSVEYPTFQRLALLQKKSAHSLYQEIHTHLSNNLTLLKHLDPRIQAR